MVNTAEFYTPLSLTLSPSSLNFGFLQVGLTSATQTVTVSNVSNHSVGFSSITRSGDYNESNNCPSTLPSNQSCTITVSFSPTAAGLRNGTVTLNDNAPGSPQQIIALSGTGGAGAVNITGVSIVPATGTFTSTNNCPATLSPQQICVFQVTFAPPDTGNYSATLTVTDNGTGSPATLALSGIRLD